MTNGTMGMVIYIVAIIAIFYFLMVRPQKKKEKEQQNMINALKKGDKITTIGGFHGKVVSSKNGVITVQMGDNKVKIESWAVKSVDKYSDAETTLLEDEAAETAETEEKTNQE